METEKFFAVYSVFPGFRHTVRSNNPEITYGDIKKSVGQRLYLQENSLCLFGIYNLYTIKPMVPLELYPDDEIAENSNHHLGIMRRSFDEVQERKVIRHDSSAFELIFLETRTLYDLGRFVGTSSEIGRAVKIVTGGSSRTSAKKIAHELKVEQHCLYPAGEKTVLKQLRDGGNDPTLKTFLKDISVDTDKLYATSDYFFEAMHALPLFYWSYYYQVPDCTLCGNTGKLLASHMNLNKKLKVDVALSQSCLSLLGATATEQYLHFIDFPWSSIRFVVLNQFRNQVSFQILLEDQKDATTKFGMINIQTDRYRYLFSVARYIIEQVHYKLFIQFDEDFFRGQYQDNIVEINSIRPASIDCDSFLAMILPQDALKIFLQNNGIEASLLLPFDVEDKDFPKEAVSYPEGFCGNINFRYILFRLKNVAELEIHPSPSGYRMITNTLTNARPQKIPAYISDRIATPLSKSKVTLPANTFSRTITVHAIGESPFKVSVYTVDHELHVCDLLKEAARSLHIGQNQYTMFTFGIFSYDNGSLLTSKRVFLQDDTLPDEISQVVFRRLSFGADRERLCWKQDITALTLLYREAHWALRENLMVPKISDRDYLLLVSLCLSKADRNTMLVFMNHFSESSEYWWKYYHKVEYCIFLNEDAVCKVFVFPPRTKLEVISPNWDNFLIVDEKGNTCIRFPTRLIHGISMNERTETVILEVAVETRSSEGYDEKFLFPISVNTSFYHYLYGVAMHAMDTSCLMMRKWCERPFKNPIFNGPFLDEWQRLNIHDQEDINIFYNSVFGLQ